MRKLYNHTKGKIHPSPPPPPPSPPPPPPSSSTTTSDNHLSLLPLAIATLAATLPPEDQQVLAYLLSISAATTTFSGGRPTKTSGAGDHPPQFNCSCFRCYTSFWVRWDASPNRKVIHEIIDAYEDGLIRSKKNGKNKKDRKNNNNNNNNNNSKCFSSSSSSSTSACGSVGLHAPPAAGEIGSYESSEVDRKIDGDDEMGSSEKGSVRKIVSFIGDRIWGVWGV